MKRNVNAFCLFGLFVFLVNVGRVRNCFSIEGIFLGKMQQNSKVITNGGRKSFSANYILGYHVIDAILRSRRDPCR